jgi:hypothetical protein
MDPLLRSPRTPSIHLLFTYSSPTIALLGAPLLDPPLRSPTTYFEAAGGRDRASGRPSPAFRLEVQGAMGLPVATRQQVDSADPSERTPQVDSADSLFLSPFLSSVCLPNSPLPPSLPPSFPRSLPLSPSGSIRAGPVPAQCSEKASFQCTEKGAAPSIKQDDVAAPPQVGGAARARGASPPWRIEKSAVSPIEFGQNSTPPMSLDKTARRRRAP